MEIFLPSYIEIGPVVYDMKIFKVFYTDIYEKLTPPPCFLTNHSGLNNLGRGSWKKHYCKIILKFVQCFMTRRFLKFSI